MRTGDGVACRYRATFGADPARQNAETVLVNVGKALAAYEETLRTGRTAFDDFRDAVARGEPAPQTYPLAAQRGLKLFAGRGKCFACHSGPNFTDGEFRATGVPPFVGQTAADTGRYAGVRTLRASRFNLLGRYNDDAARTSALATREAKLDTRDRGKWRTPSLRNVAVTAPYLHNGGAAALRDVVRRYTTVAEDPLHVDAERSLRRVDLSDRDIDDLVAFLTTLTDADGARRPLAPLVPTACD
jgi:cytochrome c peroxidase